MATPKKKTEQKKAKAPAKEKSPGIGGKKPAEKKPQAAAKSPEAQAIMDAPHSTVVKAIVAGHAKDVDGVAGKRLLSFVQRIEKLEEEKTAVLTDIKDVYGEAKGTGFDAKTIRKVVRLRKMDAEKRREEDQILELYCSAIGMD